MFSVITPTFNRAHTLDRVYQSLKAQTIKEFDWIIIDDASTDNTEELVSHWLKDNSQFQIEYYQLPENKGKPYAINYGLQFCKKPITIIADSDDSFESNTIEDLLKIWQSIDISIVSEKIAAIWTLVKDENNQLVGEPFPKNFWQVNFNERILEREQPVLGEKWHSWRTSILKDYKMCHNDNSFVSESATWFRINKNYDFLCINLIHRKYWHTEDGLIHQKKSPLKIAKIDYYTSYYQLYETNIYDIILNKYFRLLAFNYIKACFYHQDRDLNLVGLKKVICFVIVLVYAPNRLFNKLWLKFSK